MHASLVACESEFPLPSTADRRRLTALARDRNATQKHVWRAEIVLLSAPTVSAPTRSCAEPTDNLERKGIPGTRLKHIALGGRTRAPGFPAGPGHALKKLSI